MVSYVNAEKMVTKKRKKHRIQREKLNTEGGKIVWEVEKGGAPRMRDQMGG